jgi:hypothetical protein
MVHLSLLLVAISASGKVFVCQSRGELTGDSDEMTCFWADLSSSCLFVVLQLSWLCPLSNNMVRNIPKKTRHVEPRLADSWMDTVSSSSPAHPRGSARPVGPSSWWPQPAHRRPATASPGELR